MMKPCDSIRPLLSAFLDGHVSPSEKSLVERHLIECPSCPAYLLELQTLRAQLRSTPALQPPPGFYEGVQARIDAALPRKTFLFSPKLFASLATIGIMVFVSREVWEKHERPVMTETSTDRLSDRSASVSYVEIQSADQPVRPDPVRRKEFVPHLSIAATPSQAPMLGERAIPKYKTSQTNMQSGKKSVAYRDARQPVPFAPTALRDEEKNAPASMNYGLASVATSSENHALAKQDAALQNSPKDELKGKIARQDAGLQSLTFDGELRTGQVYNRSFGSGYTLRIVPQITDRGQTSSNHWTVQVVDTKGHDLTRFTPASTLDSLDTKKTEHSQDFIFSRQTVTPIGGSDAQGALIAEEAQTIRQDGQGTVVFTSANGRQPEHFHVELHWRP